MLVTMVRPEALAAEEGELSAEEDGELLGDVPQAAKKLRENMPVIKSDKNRFIMCVLLKVVVYRKG